MSQYASEAGHWYDREGNPRYKYQNKKGEWKDTTLREARKFDWWPSVSEIIKVRAADGLTNWKQDRIALTCYDNPPKPGEDRESYRIRVRWADAEQRAIAPDTGSAIHGCIERHLLKQKPRNEIEEKNDQIYRDHTVAALDCLGGWCGLDELLPERSFYHPLGFGGRCDIHKQPSGPFKHVGYVADFKTKDFDKNNPPLTYKTHAMQLAAYRHGFGMPQARCAIIFVSTRVPGDTHLVEVDQGQLDRGWLMFCKLLEYWQIEKDHRPERNL